VDLLLVQAMHLKSQLPLPLLTLLLLLLKFCPTSLQPCPTWCT
jgi:hypothetical protein